MQKRIIRALLILAGASLGISLLPAAWTAMGYESNQWLNNTVTNSLLGAIIFFLFSLLIVNYISAGIKKIEKALGELSLSFILFGAIGSLIGLLIGVIISIPFFAWNLPFVNSVVPVILMLLFGYLGFQMGTTRVEEWMKIFSSKNKKQEQQNEQDRKSVV